MLHASRTAVVVALSAASLTLPVSAQAADRLTESQAGTYMSKMSALTPNPPCQFSQRKCLPRDAKAYRKQAKLTRATANPLTGGACRAGLLALAGNYDTFATSAMTVHKARNKGPKARQARKAFAQAGKRAMKFLFGRFPGVCLDA